MSRHIASLLALAALSLGGVAGAGDAAVAASVPRADQAASADARSGGGCVARNEFRRVKKGMRKTKVHRIFGTDGRRAAISHGGGYTFEIRNYKSCTAYGAVSVGYTNGKVDSKTAVW